MERMQHAPSPAEPVVHDLVIELHGLRVTLRRSVRLFAERDHPRTVVHEPAQDGRLDWRSWHAGWMYLVLGLRWWRQAGCPAPWCWPRACSTAVRGGVGHRQCRGVSAATHRRSLVMASLFWAARSSAGR